MSYSSLLIDTCDVQRNTQGVQDAYGRPADSWDDYLEGQPCRWEGFSPFAGAGHEVYVNAKLVVADSQIFVNDIDITEQDRVVVDSITYEVLMVTLRQDGTGNHHKQCLLRTVR